MKVVRKLTPQEPNYTALFDNPKMFLDLSDDRIACWIDSRYLFWETSHQTDSLGAPLYSSAGHGDPITANPNRYLRDAYKRAPEQFRPRFERILEARIREKLEEAKQRHIPSCNYASFGFALISNKKIESLRGVVNDAIKPDFDFDYKPGVYFLFSEPKPGGNLYLDAVGHLSMLGAGAGAEFWDRFLEDRRIAGFSVLAADFPPEEKARRAIKHIDSLAGKLGQLHVEGVRLNRHWTCRQAFGSVLGGLIEIGDSTEDPTRYDRLIQIINKESPANANKLISFVNKYWQRKS